MDYRNYFKRKYPHLEYNDLEVLEGSAKEILCHLLFKSTKRISKEDKEYAYEEHQFWILRCMQEMIERSGMTSAISYSENGVSIRFGSEQLSSELINEIVPFAKFGGR